MSEKIKIADASNLRTFLGHCLMSAIGEYDPKTAKQIFVQGQEYLDVCLTINGVEVQMSNFMKLFEEQHERMLTEKARELIKDQFWERSVEIHDLLSKLERHIKEEINHVFPSDREDY